MVAGRIEMFPVTHGRGSDPQHDGWLKSFSSRVGSLATSRGAYRTRDYYWGANGSSMRLAGLRPDNYTADQPLLPVHGPWSAEPAQIATPGKLGRSEDRFAIGQELLPTVLLTRVQRRRLCADRMSEELPIGRACGRQ